MVNCVTDRSATGPLFERYFVAVIAKRPVFTSAELAQLRTLNLPETDGKPMDSAWHRVAMTLLIEIAVHFLRRRKLGYVAGNMCLYYSLKQALTKDFLGPDFFYVKQADPRKLRDKWEVWKENNLFPDVIIELISPSTKAKDLGKKKTIYEQTFQTREYFAYDPADNTLRGWRLSAITNRYESIESDDQGRMYCEELNLWLGTWLGTVERQKASWLRFFHDDGSLVLRPEEEALEVAANERAEKEAAQAEVARLRKRLESQ